MDMISDNNYTRLCGVLAAAPVYSHSSRAKVFYTFPLEIMRLSGNTDSINIIVREQQLQALEQQEDKSKICVTGQVRTFNNRHGGGAKLVITVFAQELCFCDGEDANLVRLRGTLCKEPKKRTTPMGRDICDLMLAVNRHYGRSDYLPCICWGLNANTAAAWSVGTQVKLEGRLQSRRYIKATDAGPESRTAFEVSVNEIELDTQEP